MVGRIRVVSEADGSSLGYVSRHLSSDGLYVAKAHQGDAQMFNFTSSSKPTNMYLGEVGLSPRCTESNSTDEIDPFASVDALSSL